MCPKLTQCPEGTLEIYSTYTPSLAMSGEDDGKDSPIGSNLIPQVNFAAEEKEPEAIKSISRRSADDKGKRSVPETDDELNAVSTQPQQRDYIPNDTYSEPDNATSSTLLFENSTLVHQCCTQSNCVCDTSLCPSPKCDAGLVAIVINHDVGRPGNCCPVFHCTNLPNCDTEPIGTTWRENCRSCICFNNETQCSANNCLATRNGTVTSAEMTNEQNNLDLVGANGKPSVDCFLTSLQRHFVNGSSWVQEDCYDCKCLNGEIKCQASSCRGLTCEITVKPPGECCEICDGFCKGHEYCNQHCFDGFIQDEASNCTRCECKPKKNTTPAIVVVRAETSTEPPPISGIAPLNPTIGNPSSNATQSTPEPKPSVQINIINNNYHNSTTTVAEQDETGNQNMMIVGIATFAFGLALGLLVGMLYMYKRQKKQGSYKTVPSCDTNTNKNNTYKGP